MTKKDWLILVLPVLIVTIVYPFLPAEIPRQIGLRGEIRYAGKQYLFVMGLLPFVVYKYSQFKKK